MNKKNILNNHKGISLIIIILIISVIGIVALTSITLDVSLEKITRRRQALKRINVISDALILYYRAHQDLPAPEGPNRVPVTTLNLEQKYRLDTWGNFFYYAVVKPTATTTNITGISVDTKDVAAVIISSGPDKSFNAISASPIYPPAGGWTDDIGLGVNLTAEAVENVRQELEILRKKVWARGCAKGLDNSTMFKIINEYNLPVQYQTDDWLNDYVITAGVVSSSGPDEIISTSDDISLGKLKIPCPGSTSTLPLPVAEGDGGDTGTFNIEENTGTPNGDPEITGNSDSPDGSDSAWGFDGDDWIDFGDLDLNKGQNTVSLWIKPSQITGNHGFFSKWAQPAGLDPGSWNFRLNSDGSVHFWYRDADGNQHTFRTAAGLVIEDYWHHITFVYNWGVGSSAKFYINNTRVNASWTLGNGNGPWADADIATTIGYAGSGYDQYYGLVDKITIYDVILTEPQIDEVYYLASVARYLFKGNTDDDSPHKNHGTAYGNPAIDENDRFGNSDSAIYLDGTEDYVDLGDDDSLNFKSNEGIGDVIAGGVTISAWIKTDDDYGAIVSFRNTPPSGGAVIDFMVGYDGGSTNRHNIKALVRNDDQESGQFSRASGGLIDDNKWHYVTMSRGSGSSLALYLDGVLQPTQRVGAHADRSITTDLRAIGKELYWDAVNWGGATAFRLNSRYLRGLVDDVIIFPRNITPDEILNEWCDYKNDSGVTYGAACP